MSSNTISLWGLLNNKNIIIPKIQRDYAQGRSGKEYIRRLFLKEIYESINNNKPITLDFVYGSCSYDNKSFYPIDGQQRITTLWLIYWFVTLKSGNLVSYQDVLANFTYETRESSSSFCEALCDANNFSSLKSDENIVKYIKNQTWFCSSWLQDQTISSMLRTIGESGKDDNIIGVFGKADYNKFWENLTEKDIITFKVMNIGTEQLPISDDLYIKMNARGKSLTDFENFKADLVGWINNESNPDSKELESNIPTDVTTCSNGNTKNYRQYYSKQIDTEWTDTFWHEAKNQLLKNFDGRIDEIAFSFFNRYVLNQICMEEKLKAIDFEQSKRSDDINSEKKGDPFE